MAQTRGSSNRQPPWESSNPGEGVTFGAWLRRERELRKVNLRDISDATNISIHYLEALEENRFDILPAPIFARGFLRQYSRYVGLDPDEVLNSYLTAHGEAASEEELSAPPRQQRRDWVSGLLLALLVAALLAAVAVLALYLERRGDRAEPAAALPPIAAPPPPEPLPAAAATHPAVLDPPPPLVVTLDFQGECWVEATVDEERPLSQLHVQGESLRLEAQQRVLLALGDPAAVRIEVNGEPYRLAAPPAGRAAHDILIELPPGPAPPA